MPKNNCFLALSMYCPMRNFNRHVFCGSDIVGLDQKLLDIFLSISGFIVHILMWEIVLTGFLGCYLGRAW